MARYFNDAISEVPFLADEDLTGAQWHAVKPASAQGYVAKADSACADRVALGILVNAPSQNMEASVKVVGFAKAYCQVDGTCVLNQGTFLKVASTGMLEPIGSATSAVFARYFGPNVTGTTGCAYANVLLLPGHACAVAGS